MAQCDQRIHAGGPAPGHERGNDANDVELQESGIRNQDSGFRVGPGTSNQSLSQTTQLWASVVEFSRSLSPGFYRVSLNTAVGRNRKKRLSSQALRRLLTFSVEHHRDWTCGHLRDGVHEEPLSIR